MTKTDKKRIQTPTSLIYPLVVIVVAVVIFILFNNFMFKNQLQNNGHSLVLVDKNISPIPQYGGKVEHKLAEKLETTPRGKRINVDIEVKVPPKSPYPTNLELPRDSTIKCLNLKGCPTDYPFGPTSTEPTLTQEQYADIMEKRKAFDKAYDDIVEKMVQRVADRVESLGYKITSRYKSEFGTSLPPKIIKEIANWDEVVSIKETGYAMPI